MEDTTFFGLHANVSIVGLQGGLSEAIHLKNERSDGFQFSVRSMSASQAGYATRSKNAVNYVRRLARNDA